MKKSPKVVDVFQICVIICVSAKKYPNSCILHNLTTGGRLGVRLCQMRRFKRNCAKAGIQQEIRKREHYEKPSVRRKKKSEAARKRKFK